MVVMKRNVENGYVNLTSSNAQMVTLKYFQIFSFCLSKNIYLIFLQEDVFQYCGSVMVAQIAKIMQMSIRVLKVVVMMNISVRLKNGAYRRHGVVMVYLNV